MELNRTEENFKLAEMILAGTLCGYKITFRNKEVSIHHEHDSIFTEKKRYYGILSSSTGGTRIEFANSNTKFTFRYILHRDKNLPAIEYKNGLKYHYDLGKLTSIIKVNGDKHFYLQDGNHIIEYANGKREEFNSASYYKLSSYARPLLITMADGTIFRLKEGY